MKYLVKMKNPKSGKMEAYATEAASIEELQPFLDIFTDGAGYEIVSVEKA